MTWFLQGQLEVQRQAISASKYCRVKVWDLERGAELRSLMGHTGSVSAVAVTPDGRRTMSVSDNRTLKVYDVEKGRP